MGVIQHLSTLRDDYIINGLSSEYAVRRLAEADIPEILALCEKNIIYCRYCPPFVSEQSIRDDMNALPPGKTAADKYYVGYYDGSVLLRLWI